MQRRDWMRHGALGTLTLLAGTALAQGAMPHDHHHHHGHGAPANNALVRSAAACLSTGEACLAHCLVLLGQGDQAMAACATSVNELLAVCGALHKLAAQGSPRTAAFAALAATVCADCEKACRKHAGKHRECAACADACADCVKACRGA